LAKTLSGQRLYLDRLDVAHDEQATFNRLYQHEVLPELRKVRGVLRVDWYQTESRRDPRYLTLYEIADPDVVGSPEWIAATEKTHWLDRLLPFVMNHHDGVYARIGGNAKLTYGTRYLLCVSIDIEARKEDLMNQLYDAEHIPLLLQLPGVVNVVRYSASHGNPRYLAIYEIEQPEIPTTREWAVASDMGRWKLEVKPYTYNRSFIVYEAMDGRVAPGKMEDKG
jgi:hypothetical protein